MRVLSIDWDYFVDMTNKEAINYLPDAGRQFGDEIQNLIWVNCYADSRKKLLDIDIRHDEYAYMKQIIDGLDESTMVYYANTHEVLYTLLKRDGYLDRDKDIEIVNVDYHHDIFNHTGELNCGNWVNFIAKEGNLIEYTWVRQDLSVDDDEGLAEFSYDNDIFMYSSLKPFVNDVFDAVFICRSDAWSPPHLDKYYAELVEFLTQHIGYTLDDISDRLYVPRYTDGFRENVEQMMSLTSDLMKTMEKKVRT